MAYLILETNFFSRPDMDSVMHRWGLRGVAAVVYLYHTLQQYDDCQCDVYKLTYSARKIGTTRAFLSEIITQSGLFERCSGNISAPYLAKRLERSKRKKASIEARKAENKTLQVADSQTKSLSYTDIDIDKDIDKDKENKDKDIDKDKDYDVVDNTRARIIDFGPDADDVDFLTLCIDKIFSQQIWLQSLASEGRFPIAYELKGAGGGARYAWRDDLTELTKEWFRMRMMALKDFRNKTADDMKQYFFHLMRPGSQTREEYIEWMKKKMKN